MNKVDIPDINFKPTPLPNVGFQIITLSELYQKADLKGNEYMSYPHRVHFHNILIYNGEEGQHFVDFKNFPVKKGSVVTVKKGQIHAFDMTNKPDGLVVVFTDHYMNTISAAMNIRVVAPTHLMTTFQQSVSLIEPELETISTLLALINQNYHASEPNPQYLQVLFSALLIKLNDASPDFYHHQLHSHQIIFFERFMAKLEQHLCQRYDAHQYANLIGTSYKTLNKICKLACKLTVKQLIDAYTILEAKRRLSIDNIQVQQLAEYLGFDETSNFVKYFKKHTLLTPSQFKQNQ